MRTRIISAFPGTGKSYYRNLHPETCLDSDSSLFSWIPGTGRRNPNFPKNYIDHIKENIGKYEIIFVSTHKEVREALLDNCLFFYLIYPSVHVKQKFIERYIARGNSSDFVKLLTENWEKWIDDLSFPTTGCQQIEMVFPYMVKAIQHIIYSENGEE